MNPEDDLFRPSLRAEDDAVDFHAPWNPWSLVVLTFFFGLVAGGGLLAFNYQRLGIKGRLYQALAVVGLVWLLQMGLLFWLLETRQLVAGDRESSQLFRWGGRAVTTLIAIGMAAPQQKRYRLFQASGLPGGNLLWPALAAIGVSLLLNAPFLTYLFHQIFSG